MRRSLEQDSDVWSETAVGAVEHATVLLVRDSPPEKRCWFRVIMKDCFVALEFAGERQDHLIRALRDAESDLLGIDGTGER